MDGKMLCFLFSLNFLLMPCISIISNDLQTPKLQACSRFFVPPNASGPESLAFSSKMSNRLYASISDGRVVVVQYNHDDIFTEFATTAPNRSKKLCDGKSDPSLEPVCGRPLGLSFDSGGRVLYVVDAYFGLMSVGPNGGMAQRLATSAEDVPFRSLNALDIDPTTGTVYFTDASTIYQRREIFTAIGVRDRTGRLLSYNPKTKQVTVLMKNLGVPVGVAVSKEGDFVIVSEYIDNTTTRYWIKGSKTGQSDVFAKLPAPPDNIKRNTNGEFWVALNFGTELSFGQKLNRNGFIVKTLEFDVGNGSSSTISEVHEYEGKFYVGSLTLPYVGVYRI